MASIVTMIMGAYDDEKTHSRFCTLVLFALPAHAFTQAECLWLIQRILTLAQCQWFAQRVEAANPNASPLANEYIDKMMAEDRK